MVAASVREEEVEDEEVPEAVPEAVLEEDPEEDPEEEAVGEEKPELRIHWTPVRANALKMDDLQTRTSTAPFPSFHSRRIDLGSCY